MKKTHDIVRRVFSTKDIVILAAVLAAGIACLFVNGDGWKGTGVIILCCLAMMIPFFRHGYRIEGQKGMFLLTEFLSDRECKQEIKGFLEGKLASYDPKPIVPGGALVEVYTRKSDGLMLARYYDFDEHLSGAYGSLSEVSPSIVSRFEELSVKKK